MAAESPTISAVIITCDEAEVLEGCLRSVRGWVDEVVVVDMQSSDGSHEIAARYADVLRSHPRLEYGDPARAFALGLAGGDWILMLDPDEQVPAPLAQKLRALAEGDAPDLVMVPRRAHAFGAPLTATGYQHDEQPRFFRAGVVYWPSAIHGRPDLRGLRCVRLPREDGLWLEHRMWRDAEGVMDMLRRYTPHEVENFRHAGRPYRTVDMQRDTWRAFYWSFLKGAGYRDGTCGLWVALIHVMYQLCSHLCLWQADGCPDDLPLSALRNQALSPISPHEDTTPVRRTG